MNAVAAGFGFVRALIVLLLLLFLGVAAWVRRDRLIALWEHSIEPIAETPASTERTAEAARARIEDVETGRTARAALSQDEVAALLRHDYADHLPAYIDSVRVEFAGDRLLVSLRMPTDRIPRTGGLAPFLQWMPDTTLVRAAGRLVPFTAGRVAIAIDELEAATIPLPDSFIPPVLESLGRTDEPGLAPDAIAVPLPPGVQGAYVRADSLVLVGRAAANPRD